MGIRHMPEAAWLPPQRGNFVKASGSAFLKA
jgi:hypothetical protein